MKKLDRHTKLDGTLVEELESAKRIIANLTDEEKERAISDEFAYLDEDID